MNQGMNRPIKLDKLVLEILRRWRTLIIVFIIGLVVGITYSYFDNINEAIGEVDTGKHLKNLSSC